MKMQILKSTLLLLVLSRIAFAQDSKIIKLKIAEMENRPEQMITMAYRSNVLNFAKVLRSIGFSGDLTRLENARKTFAEIKRSMEQMDESHLRQMQSMSAEMVEIMYTRMAKMQTENALIYKHLAAIERSLKYEYPDLSEIYTNAAGIVFQLIGKESNKPKARRFL